MCVSLVGAVCAACMIVVAFGWGVTHMIGYLSLLLRHASSGSPENSSEGVWDPDLDDYFPSVYYRPMSHKGFGGIAPRWQSAVQIVNFLLIIAPSVCMFFFFTRLWGKSVGILVCLAIFTVLLYAMPRLLGFLGFPPWPDRSKA